MKLWTKILLIGGLLASSQAFAVNLECKEKTGGLYARVGPITPDKNETYKTMGGFNEITVEWTPAHIMYTTYYVNLGYSVFVRINRKTLDFITDGDEKGKCSVVETNPDNKL